MKTKPCNDCPFIKDGIMRASLHPERREEIANALLHDSDFPCHKTTKPRGNTRYVSSNSKRCIGAVMWLDNAAKGGKFSNVCMRVAAMAGEFPATLEPIDSICKTYEEFVND